MRPAVLLLILGAACRTAPGEAAPCPIRITPDETGRRQVFIESADGAWKWRLRFPERAFCDEAILVPHDFRKVIGPVTWRREADGSLAYTRKNAEDSNRPPEKRVDYEVRVSPRPYGAELVLAFTNREPHPLTNLAGHVCLSHLSEPFRDPDHELGYFRSGGKFVNINDTDRGADPVRTHYRVKGKPVIKLFARPQNRFWGEISASEADGGLILTRSRHGRALIALWFEPACELFQNSDDFNMCIHSDPHYGDLAPGERREIRGRLILFRGTLEEFERVYP